MKYNPVVCFDNVYRSTGPLKQLHALLHMQYLNMIINYHGNTTNYQGNCLYLLPAHFPWLAPVMKWAASHSKLHFDVNVIQTTALGFVQDRRKNPTAKVLVLKAFSLHCTPIYKNTVKCVCRGTYFS